jgi:hypothetical protein
MRERSERMKAALKHLVRLWCFLRGHDMIDLYRMTNTDRGGSSHWGCHKCMRCGKEESWQYDM